jgi:hypothetical protein
MFRLLCYLTLKPTKLAVEVVAKKKITDVILGLLILGLSMPLSYTNVT